MARTRATGAPRPRRNFAAPPRGGGLFGRPLGAAPADPPDAAPAPVAEAALPDAPPGAHDSDAKWDWYTDASSAEVAAPIEQKMRARLYGLDADGGGNGGGGGGGEDAGAGRDRINPVLAAAARGDTITAWSVAASQWWRERLQAQHLAVLAPHRERLDPFGALHALMANASAVTLDRACAVDGVAGAPRSALLHMAELMGAEDAVRLHAPYVLQTALARVHAPTAALFSGTRLLAALGGAADRDALAFAIHAAERQAVYAPGLSTVEEHHNGGRGLREVVVEHACATLRRGDAPDGAMVVLAHVDALLRNSVRFSRRACAALRTAFGYPPAPLPGTATPKAAAAAAAAPRVDAAATAADADDAEEAELRRLHDADGADPFLNRFDRVTARRLRDATPHSMQCKHTAARDCGTAIRDDFDLFYGVPEKARPNAPPSPSSRSGGPVPVCHGLHPFSVFAHQSGLPNCVAGTDWSTDEWRWASYHALATAAAAPTADAAATAGSTAVDAKAADPLSGVRAREAELHRRVSNQRAAVLLEPWRAQYAGDPHVDAATLTRTADSAMPTTSSGDGGAFATPNTVWHADGALNADLALTAPDSADQQRAKLQHLAFVAARRAALDPAHERPDEWYTRLRKVRPIAVGAATPPFNFTASNVSAANPMLAVATAVTASTASTETPAADAPAASASAAVVAVDAPVGGESAGARPLSGWLPVVIVRVIEGYLAAAPADAARAQLQIRLQTELMALLMDANLTHWAVRSLGGGVWPGVDPLWPVCTPNRQKPTTLLESWAKTLGTAQPQVALRDSCFHAINAFAVPFGAGHDRRHCLAQPAMTPAEEQWFDRHYREARLWAERDAAITGGDGGGPRRWWWNVSLPMDDTIHRTDAMRVGNPIGAYGNSPLEAACRSASGGAVRLLLAEPAVCVDRRALLLAAAAQDAELTARGAATPATGSAQPAATATAGGSIFGGAPSAAPKRRPAFAAVAPAPAPQNLFGATAAPPSATATATTDGAVSGVGVGAAFGAVPNSQYETALVQAVLFYAPRAITGPLFDRLLAGAAPHSDAVDALNARCHKALLGPRSGDADGVSTDATTPPHWRAVGVRLTPRTASYETLLSLTLKLAYHRNRTHAAVADAAATGAPPGYTEAMRLLDLNARAIAAAPAGSTVRLPLDVDDCDGERHSAMAIAAGALLGRRDFDEFADRAPERPAQWRVAQEQLLRVLYRQTQVSRRYGAAVSATVRAVVGDALPSAPAVPSAVWECIDAYLRVAPPSPSTDTTDALTPRLYTELALLTAIEEQLDFDDAQAAPTAAAAVSASAAVDAPNDPVRNARLLKALRANGIDPSTFKVGAVQWHPEQWQLFAAPAVVATTTTRQSLLLLLARYGASRSHCDVFGAMRRLFQALVYGAGDVTGRHCGPCAGHLNARDAFGHTPLSAALNDGAELMTSLLLAEPAVRVLTCLPNPLLLRTLAPPPDAATTATAGAAAAGEPAAAGAAPAPASALAVAPAAAANADTKLAVGGIASAAATATAVAAIIREGAAPPPIPRGQRVMNACAAADTLLLTALNTGLCSADLAHARIARQLTARCFGDTKQAAPELALDGLTAVAVREVDAEMHALGLYDEDPDATAPPVATANSENAGGDASAADSSPPAPFGERRSATQCPLYLACWFMTEADMASTAHSVVFVGGRRIATTAAAAFLYPDARLSYSSSTRDRIQFDSVEPSGFPVAAVRPVDTARALLDVNDAHLARAAAGVGAPLPLPMPLDAHTASASDDRTCSVRAKGFQPDDNPASVSAADFGLSADVYDHAMLQCVQQLPNIVLDGVDIERHVTGGAAPPKGSWTPLFGAVARGGARGERRVDKAAALEWLAVAQRICRQQVAAYEYQFAVRLMLTDLCFGGVDLAAGVKLLAYTAGATSPVYAVLTPLSVVLAYLGCCDDFAALRVLFERLGGTAAPPLATALEMRESHATEHARAMARTWRVESLSEAPFRRATDPEPATTSGSVGVGSDGVFRLSAAQRERLVCYRNTVWLMLSIRQSRDSRKGVARLLATLFHDSNLTTPPTLQTTTLPADEKEPASAAPRAIDTTQHALFPFDGQLGAHANFTPLHDVASAAIDANAPALTTALYIALRATGALPHALPQPPAAVDTAAAAVGSSSLARSLAPVALPSAAAVLAAGGAVPFGDDAGASTAGVGAADGGGTGVAGAAHPHALVSPFMVALALGNNQFVRLALNERVRGADGAWRALIDVNARAPCVSFAPPTNPAFGASFRCSAELSGSPISSSNARDPWVTPLEAVALNTSTQQMTSGRRGANDLDEATVVALIRRTARDTLNAEQWFWKTDGSRRAYNPLALALEHRNYELSRWLVATRTETLRWH